MRNFWHWKHRHERFSLTYILHAPEMYTLCDEPHGLYEIKNKTDVKYLKNMLDILP